MGGCEQSGGPDAEHRGHEHLKEPEQRRLIPERAMLWRGLGLLALAGGALAAAAGAGQRSAWLAATVGPVLGLAGVLAGWAAAIHLTGGERFDDHPFV